ncbi:MAG: hypothetical protein ACK4GN_03090, partial [Runella sp.]
WHINADEPTVLDYNTEFKSAAQITSLYNADAFRSSDHDAVIVGLNLLTPCTPTVSIAITTGSNPTCSGSSITFTATPTNGGASPS